MGDDAKPSSSFVSGIILDGTFFIPIEPPQSRVRRNGITKKCKLFTTLILSPICSIYSVRMTDKNIITTFNDITAPKAGRCSKVL